MIDNQLFNKLHPMTRRAIEHVVQGNLLDIGAKSGIVSVIAEQKGLEVTALDKDTSQISSDFKGEIIESDIRNFDFQDDSFDNIFCNFVLHFMSREEALIVLSKIQSATKPGGINYASDFLALPPMYKEQQSFWLKLEELKELYGGWEIVHYEEATTGTYSGGYQSAAFLIAKKPT